MALAIQHAGDIELARVETDKILSLAPDHIPARTMRVEQAIETGRFDLARTELDTILKHPRLIDHLEASPDSLKPFHNLIRLYLHAKRLDDAQMIARAVRDLAYRLKRDIGWSQFYLAQVYAVKARTEPCYIKHAADQLYIAFHANPGFKQWYEGTARSDPPTIPAYFDPVRPQIDAELRRKGDAADVRRRLASANSRRK